MFTLTNATHTRYAERQQRTEESITTLSAPSICETGCYNIAY
uniref:Uncharacterized protein n=1 Tax=Heterorhabditis bacteriophora TaxID=37862 RepID=A0A1I7X6D7_HETBA